MLKVLKYDWRNGWNGVKHTLLAAVIVSVLLGIFLGFVGGRPMIADRIFAITGEDGMDSTVMVFSVVWFSVMAALLVLTVDAIARNMSTRMFGPEGYLTHTLPVETWELLGGKALGTWLFGVFMVCVAIGSVMLVMVSTVVSTGYLGEMLKSAVAFLPKLGEYHFRSLAAGAGYVLYGIAAFLVWSFLIVVQYQFICIAARQFGRFHVAGGIILFCVLLGLEGNLNKLFSMGFLVCLVSSAACFCGSWWLLKKRLSI